MQTKGQYRSLTASLIVSCAALILTACLPSEEGETSFDGRTSGPSGGGSSGGGSDGNSAPTIVGTPADAVTIGDTYSFSPDASDPDGDTLTFSVDNKPSWADFNTSTGRLSGQPSLGDVGEYGNIRISVSDGQATASTDRFAVSVIQVGTVSTTLSWTPPTENEDGTPLMDLAGYKLYWGTRSGIYDNSVTIDNPGLTTYVVENLAPGTYEFVATAYNTSGIESDYSNLATKVLQ